MIEQVDNSKSKAPRHSSGRPARTMLALTIMASSAMSFAQQKGIAAHYTGTAGAQAPPSASAGKLSHNGGGTPALVTASPASSSIVFNPAAVGVSAALAQQITATFDVSGYTGTFIPTATLHYGLSYSLGAVACTGGGAGDESCSVNVTFQPLYPGGRPDALLLTDGSGTVLATVPVNGLGQGPIALIQPGVVTQPVTTGGYYYTSVVGEDGTSYYVSMVANAVYALTPLGALTQLPITGLYKPIGIAMDGAGTLYISQNNYGSQLITYTAAGVQGTFNVAPPTPPYMPCQNSNNGMFEYPFLVATDNVGDVFTFEDLCQQIFEFGPGGSFATTTLAPGFPGPYQMVVDSSGNLFIDGYAINELTPGGVQTQVNAAGGGADAGIAVDAADTLYAARYYNAQGVGELPASNYASMEANLDPTSNPLGVSVGPDGTVFVGNYTNIDRIDRSQGLIDFGQQYENQPSSTENVQIYNGGNGPLTIGTISVTGMGFALQTATASPCSSSLVIAPGALCNIGVMLTPTVGGDYSGNITVPSDSLNASSMVVMHNAASSKKGSVTSSGPAGSGTPRVVAFSQVISLKGQVSGINLTTSPTSLAFGYLVPGSTTTLPVTLTNKGSVYSANLGTITFSDPAFAIVTNSCPQSLAAGANCQLTVSFSPALAQDYSANMVVPATSSYDGVLQQANVALTGTGINPYIPLNILEVIDVSDNTPSLALSTLLPILENIQVTDTAPLVLSQQDTVLLASSTTVANVGSNVTFTATVKPTGGGPSPTGTVIFSDSGSTLATVSLTGGVATYSSSSLAAGSHILSAQYSGDSNYESNNSNTLTVTETTKSILTVTPNNVSRTFGGFSLPLSYTITGFVNGDTIGVVGGKPVLSTTAVPRSLTGTYLITATIGTLTAPANYIFTFGTGTLTIAPLNVQTVSFNGIPPLSLTRIRQITMAAHSTSGQPIGYTVSGPATVSGNVITLNGTGQVTVTATQSGNSTFAPSTAAVQTFQVTP